MVCVEYQRVSTGRYTDYVALGFQPGARAGYLLFSQAQKTDRYPRASVQETPLKAPGAPHQREEPIPGTQAPITPEASEAQVEEPIGALDTDTAVRPLEGGG